MAASAGTTEEPGVLENLRALDSRRVGARLIDGLLISVAWVVADVAVDPLRLWHVCALLWLSTTYFFVLEAMTGQTLGKRCCGLQVVSRDGAEPGLNAIATRNIIRLAEEPVIALLVLVGSRKRRQRVGDLFAGTTVGRAGLSPMRGGSPRLVAYPALWAAGAAVFIGFIVPDPGRVVEQTGDQYASGQSSPGLVISREAYLAETAEGFAETVDRVCAYNFNRAIAAENEIVLAARSEGLPRDELAGRMYHSRARFQLATHRMTGQVEPLKHRNLFERWRGDVKDNALLLERNSALWLTASGEGAGRLIREMETLSLTANERGRDLGMHLCTLPGPRLFWSSGVPGPPDRS